MPSGVRRSSRAARRRKKSGAEEEHRVRIRHQRRRGVNLGVGAGRRAPVVVDHDFVRWDPQDVLAAFRAVVILTDDPTLRGGQVTFLAALAVAGVGKLGLQLRPERRPMATEPHVYVVQPRVGRRAAVRVEAQVEQHAGIRWGLDRTRRACPGSAAANYRNSPGPGTRRRAAAHGEQENVLSPAIATLRDRPAVAHSPMIFTSTRLSRLPSSS